jgi:hypothetical protein
LSFDVLSFDVLSIRCLLLQHADVDDGSCGEVEATELLILVM